MSESQEFEHIIDLTVLMLATEELAKHTDKTAAEWRSQFIDEALLPYIKKLPEGYTPTLKSLRKSHPGKTENRYFTC